MRLLCILQLRAAQEEFTAFYNGKYKDRRKLTWQHTLGHCVLRAMFPHVRWPCLGAPSFSVR